MPRLRPLGAAALVLSLAACSDDDTDRTVADDPETVGVRWQSCPAPRETLDCGTLDVPLDPDLADGETITLDLARLPATGAKGVRTLFVNPGGPGGASTELVATLAELGTVPEAVRERFDLVGVDPRGIGASSRVDCTALGLDELDEYPIGAEGRATLAADNAAFAERCHARHAVLLPRLGSRHVVHDLERVRRALGVPELHFLGYSYGTRLAALYLQEYPEHAGRVVLDASLPPDSSVPRLAAGQLAGTRANFTLVFDDCGDYLDGCDAETLAETFATRVRTLLAEGREDELDLIGELLLTTIQTPTLGRLTAEPLARYITSGDPTPIERLLARPELAGLVDRLESEDDDNATAGRAVLCADDATRPTAVELDALAAELESTFDPFAEVFVALAAICSGWPEALDPLEDITTRVAPRALVIGGTADAQTPLPWAESMAAAIGGRLLRSEHLGHTASFRGRSRCVDEAVSAFLLDGTLPERERCPPEPTELELPKSVAGRDGRLPAERR